MRANVYAHTCISTIKSKHACPSATSRQLDFWIYANSVCYSAICITILEALPYIMLHLRFSHGKNESGYEAIISWGSPRKDKILWKKVLMVSWLTHFPWKWLAVWQDKSYIRHCSINPLLVTLNFITSCMIWYPNSALSSFDQVLGRVCSQPLSKSNKQERCLQSIIGPVKH